MLSGSSFVFSKTFWELFLILLVLLGSLWRVFCILWNNLEVMITITAHLAALCGLFRMLCDISGTIFGDYGTLTCSVPVILYSFHIGL